MDGLWFCRGLPDVDDAKVFRIFREVVVFIHGLACLQVADVQAAALHAVAELPDVLCVVRIHCAPLAVAYDEEPVLLVLRWLVHAVEADDVVKLRYFGLWIAKDQLLKGLLDSRQRVLFAREFLLLSVEDHVHIVVVVAQGDNHLCGIVGQHILVAPHASRHVEGDVDLFCLLGERSQSGKEEQEDGCDFVHDVGFWVIMKFSLAAITATKVNNSL